MTGAPLRAGRRSYDEHGAYINPRLNNRPELDELEPPRAVEEVMPNSSWRAGLMLDAHAVVDGLDWFRVKGGFGAHNDREDYIAAMPTGSLSVTGWEVERGDGDVSAAMREAVDRALAQQPARVSEARQQAHREMQRLAVLQEAVYARRGQQS